MKNRSANKRQKRLIFIIRLRFKIIINKGKGFKMSTVSKMKYM